MGGVKLSPQSATTAEARTHLLHAHFCVKVQGFPARLQERALAAGHAGQFRWCLAEDALRDAGGARASKHTILKVRHKPIIAQR